MSSPLQRSIRRVVRRGNCTGCGGCSALSRDVQMELSDDGFMRPTFTGPGSSDTNRNAREFRRVCPGIQLTAPPVEKDAVVHPIFGRYVASWEGWATDPAVRFAGSSGGVLTALVAWLTESGRSHEVLGASMSQTEPSRTVPVTIMSRADALASAGSRYGPVATLSHVPSMNTRLETMVGKPCEVSAAYQLALEAGPKRPLLLSFFCAGTPSQKATDRLVEQFGVGPRDLSSVRYRGDGWPGRFEVKTTDGEKYGLSYDESWGNHLGRDLQWRCKVCVDGTGEHADVAVGDFWRADANGYPLFDDADGTSVVIARTKRGAELLHEAQAEGVIALRPLGLDMVAKIQPLQVARRVTLLGRIAGRTLALKKPPRYRGYMLVSHARASALKNIRAMLGTFRRSIR